ncbi:ATP-dependent DNA ligase [Candidatus Woesearchaeota archaeon]|jgi:DNA ligase 1|nr:ATP-dependent DNA ligase [Candidatus Woesearchaeota archaeon]MBT4322014.1 ATP-dependent DNA ligase [Candidatus Woesearchaeota archaeon]MBT4630760.1 ATP-dependent DNA ligase [Candidatus Woesearchaeota archaeon]
MDYSKLVKYYQELEKTTKRLEKTKIIAELLKKTPDEHLEKIIFLLEGRIFPKWDERKTGISSRLLIKAINSSTGVPNEKIEKEWVKKGDLGEVVEELIKTKKQTTLFSKKLTITKVFENIRKLSELEGQGTISKKIQLITELFTSSTPEEARFIARTVIEDLRIGVKEGVIRDAIVWAFLPRVKGINEEGTKTKPKKITKLKNSDLKFKLIETEDPRKTYNELSSKVEHAYNLTNDYAEVALAAKKHKLNKLFMQVGKPINPMLAIKAESPEDAFKHLGKPALLEYKLDGFRLQIHKNGDEIKLFTRRLENVTKQFEEIMPTIRSHVKVKSCILDSELVGFDPKTKHYLPFQNISKRIKRKYDIGKKSKELPVEINVFDIIQKDNETLIDKTQEERRKILEKIIKQEKTKIILTKKLVTSSEKELNKFYKESLKKGNEGIMIKNLKAKYIPGRRVGGWLKLKPVKETLDLIIVAADWGEGKRAKWLSSFTIACRDKNKLLTIGKVGTGIAEKDSELTFEKLTKELKPSIKEKKGKQVILKPKIILEISYDEIQKSPTYTSKFALRFPRVIKLRSDLGFNDIDTLERVEKFYKQQNK